MIVRTGVQGRNLDDCCPDWQAVYYYFDKWKKKGTFEKVNIGLNILECSQSGRRLKRFCGRNETVGSRVVFCMAEYLPEGGRGL